MQSVIPLLGGLLRFTSALSRLAALQCGEGLFADARTNVGFEIAHELAEDGDYKNSKAGKAGFRE